MLSDEELAAIRQRADEATPPPWKADTTVRGDCVVWGPDGSFIANQQAEPHWLPAPDGGTRAVVFDVDRRDSEFIAAARTDVPGLLSEVERLTAELAEAERKGWHRGWDAAVQRQVEFDNKIMQFIPERYEANYNAIEEWANDAAQVIVAALHLHKFGVLGPFPGLAAAIEKMYPSEDPA
jgi:hypothetical protein